MMKKLLTLLVLFATLTANAQYYLRGDVNGWGTGDDYQFTKVDNNKNIYLLKVGSLSGQFKFASEGWGADQYGLANEGTIQNGHVFDLVHYNNCKNINLDNQIDNAIIMFSSDNNKARVSQVYGLKHAGWGNNDWGWKGLTKNSDGTWSVEAQYNGGGVNYSNGTNIDELAVYIETPTLKRKPQVGDNCTFTFNPNDGTVTITEITQSWKLTSSTNFVTSPVNFTKQTDGSWTTIIKNKDLSVSSQENYMFKAERNNSTAVCLPSLDEEMLFFDGRNGNYDINFTIDAEETVLKYSVNSNAPISISIEKDKNKNYYAMEDYQDGTYRYFTTYSAANKVSVQKNDNGNKEIVEVVTKSVSENKSIKLAEDGEQGLVPPTEGQQCTYIYVPKDNETDILYIQGGTVTGVEDVKVCGNGSKAVKMIENGQVVIVKDGKKYNVMGQAVK